MQMNKRKLHHIWRIIRKVSYWYFLIACIICVVVAIFALRNNNLTAVQLRDAVIKTDKDNGDTEAALRKLREYVHAHMHTNLATDNGIYPPIQLRYRYERLVATEKAKLEQQKGNTYKDAQDYCEKNSPQSFYGAGRLPCIQNYIDTHPISNKEISIPDGLYKYNFESPVWSPDLAGWSIVLSGFFFLMFIIRLMLGLWLQQKFKEHL